MIRSDAAYSFHAAFAVRSVLDGNNAYLRVLDGFFDTRS
jgi:hypothetical protein